MKTCAACGKSLAGLDERRKYCSDECCHEANSRQRRESRRRGRERKTCANCGKPMADVDGRSKYCSEECCHEANNRQKRERMRNLRERVKNARNAAQEENLQAAPAQEAVMEQAATTIFSHPEFGDVRVVNEAGEPLFVGKDVAIALGYSNPNDALAKHVPAKHKLVSQIATTGQRRSVVLITEAGLYKLVFASKLPKAVEFSDWVCEKVIPAIRKTGVYMTTQAAEQILLNPDFIIKLARQVKEAQAEIERLQPKADYCERVLESKEHLTSELIAKEYGKTAHWLHETLIKLGAMYMRRRGTNYYYYMKSPYDKEEYRDSETTVVRQGLTVVNYYWTQKGRNFIYHFLKKRGIVPLVEREEAQADLFKEVQA